MKSVNSSSWEIPVQGTVSQYFSGAENKSGHKSLILCWKLGMTCIRTHARTRARTHTHTHT